MNILSKNTIEALRSKLRGNIFTSKASNLLSRIGIFVIARPASIVSITAEALTTLQAAWNALARIQNF